MSVEDQNIPPVPSQSPLNESDAEHKKFGIVWSQWFETVRKKVNILNASIVALAGTTTNGILTHIPGGWATRSIAGEPGEIEVTNADGSTGNPTVGLSDTDVNPGSYTNVNATVDQKGRITAISNGSGGGGGGNFITGINTQTVTPYTLVAGDVGKLVDMDILSGTINLPTSSSLSVPIASTIQVGCRNSILTIVPVNTSITLIDATVPMGSGGSFGGLININIDIWYIWGNIQIRNDYRTLILSFSPIAYWTFDSVLTSLVGSFTWIYQSGTALTYTTPLITTGEAASTTNAYYSIPYNSSFTTLTFSIIIWVKFTNTDNTVIFECNGNAGFSVQNNIGRIQLNIGGTSSVLLSNSVNNGLPHCVIFSCTPTSQKVYTDGILSNSYSFSLSNSLASSPLYLGSRAGFAPYVGVLDELAFIPSAISSTNALAIYNAGI